MNKQIILIPLIAALATAGGWEILQTEKAKPKSDAEAHEHGHEEGEEHGDEHAEEGHVKLSPEARKHANLKIEEAAAAKVVKLLPLYGKIASNEEALAHVQPRFPGIVKQVRKRLGEAVSKGDLLAIVESNESLRDYEIKSEIAGTVIQKDITIGEFVKSEDTVFTIADLSTVWVDLAVFRDDFRRLKVGQRVMLHLGAERGDADHEAIETKVAYISPFGTEGTQSMLARCIVSNPDGDLRPGLFVTAEIATGEIDAPVAVRLAAIQTLEEKTVVFVPEGDAFEAREVKLGARDAQFAEVLEGLKPGDQYVSDNSFLLKAEIGKEEAEHDH